MDRLDAQQRRLGRVEAARVEILLCAREPAAGQTFALGVVVALQFEIARLLGEAGALTFTYLPLNQTRSLRTGD